MPRKRRGELARRFPHRRVPLPPRQQGPSPQADVEQEPGRLDVGRPDVGRQDLVRQDVGRRATLRHVPFETLVERALDELPEDFHRLLEDVAIVIEEVPTPEQSRLGGVPDEDWLYGLYEGVPAIEWGASYAALPNKISLFRLPLEADFPDPDELAEQVRITVIHELAHHAGIDDERLHELGVD